MSTETHGGGCFCSKVRYNVSGPPLSRSICHCVSCRKSAGAQSVAWLTFPYEGFSLVSGEPRVHNSSPHVERTFCGECGTTLTYRNDSEPETIDITAASLDFPEKFPPMKHIWTEDGLSWIGANDDLPRFERGGAPVGEA